MEVLKILSKRKICNEHKYIVRIKHFRIFLINMQKVPAPVVFTCLKVKRKGKDLSMI